RSEGAGALEAVAAFETEDAPMLKLVSSGPLEVAADLPEETAALLVVNWGDPSAFFGGILDIIVEIEGRQGGGYVQEQLAEAEINFGVRFDELLAQLGSGTAVFYPPAGPSVLIDRQDWTAVLLLEDAEGFEWSLDNLTTKALGMAPGTIPFEGVTMSRLMFPPVTYKVLADRIVLGGSPRAVKRHLDWQADAGRKTLLAAIGDTPAALMARLDLGLLLNSYPATESGPKAVLALAREGKLLRMNVGLEDFDAENLYRIYMTAYPSIMAAMLMPALSRARGEAQKSVGRANLHNIGLGIAMYRADNDEYPQSLEDLYDWYVDAEEIFVDPVDTAPVQRGDLGLRYSYEYVGRIPSEVPASTIICYSRKGVHPGGRNVLYVDMAVMWVSEEDLHDPLGGARTSLRQSYDAVVAALGDQLPPERDAELREFYEIED
ncbi:MAG: hypothetical protein KAX19_13355, partial [Candidatus Brocadiae bacterium]|nr:hypothetical protein [Candidatus Brocadiia bacterium]